MKASLIGRLAVAVVPLLVPLAACVLLVAPPAAGASKSDAGAKRSKVQGGPALVQASEKKMPRWITEIPEDKEYFSFVGTSGDAESYDRGKEEAIEDALSQVVKMIGVTVTSTTTYEERYFAEQYETTISAELFAEGRAKLQDAEIREIYFEKYARRDGNSFFRVWVLLRYGKSEVEREQARLKAILEAKYGEVSALEARGEELAKGHRLAGAIAAHIQAAAASLAVDDGKLLFDRNMNRAQELLLKVRAEKEGEDQIGYVGEALKAPLRIRFYEEEGGKRYPIEGLQVQFAYVVPREKFDGYKRVMGTRVTETDGAAEYSVEMVYEVSERNIVEASIDFGPLLALLQNAPPDHQDRMRAFREILAKQTATFAFRSDTHARGVKTAVYFLQMDEHGELVEAPFTAPAAYEVLFDKKFSIRAVTLDPVSLRGLQERRILELLAGSAGEDVARVIYGQARILGYDTVSGYDTAQAQADAALYDLRSGNVLRTWQVTRSGTGGTRDIARGNAMKEAGKAIGNLISNTIP